MGLPQLQWRPGIVILGLTGLVHVSTFTVAVVLAQEMFPHNLGVASGLMVGFAIGMGGIGVTLLGYLADLWGVPFALKTIALMPVIGLGIAWFIAYPQKAPRDHWSLFIYLSREPRSPEAWHVPFIHGVSFQED